MTDTVIHARGVGKRYTIGALRDSEKESTMIDMARDAARSVARTARGLFRPDDADDRHHIWALRHIDFDVQRGEVVGIIGHNGAGKSTLLKILTRITDPTEGEIRLRGRVGALLEVGTGFNGMLSGRENVYLNGAILGMTRGEIDHKFDEIVDFAGVEKFIDTPVRHYSSGMYLRLAFAVAAHLEPEILLVDEVLAVGDAAFQKKCLGKMSEVAGEGRTVLFVSHNMMAVQELCERVMLLKGGEMLMSGEPEEVIDCHLKMSEEEAGSQRVNIMDLSQYQRPDVVVSDEVRFTHMYLADENGQPVQNIRYGGTLRLVIGLTSRVDRDELTIGMDIHTNQGVRVSVIDSDNSDVFFSVRAGQRMEIVMEAPDIMLTPGTYRIQAIAIRYQRGAPLDRILDPIQFSVLSIKADPTLPVPSKKSLIGLRSTWTQHVS